MIVFCVILTLVCSWIALRACHVWLTRNHKIIQEILGKFTSFIFWNFEIFLVSLERFQNFKKVNSVNLPPNLPLKHVITSTNLLHILRTSFPKSTSRRLLLLYFHTAKSILHFVWVKTKFNPLLCNVVKWSDTHQKSYSICCKISKVCLTILRQCEVKG